MSSLADWSGVSDAGQRQQIGRFSELYPIDFGILGANPLLRFILLEAPCQKSLATSTPMMAVAHIAIGGPSKDDWGVDHSFVSSMISMSVRSRSKP
jgi:hypothetical protein